MLYDGEYVVGGSTIVNVRGRTVKISVKMYRRYKFLRNLLKEVLLREV